MLPTLLGHRPSDSLVAIYHRAEHPVLSARIDWGHARLRTRAVTHHLSAVGQRSGARSAVLLVIEPADVPGATAPVSTLEVVRAVASIWPDEGPALRWTCVVASDHWSSPECERDCPESGHSCELPRAGPSRDEVLAEVTARDEVAASQLRELLHTRATVPTTPVPVRVAQELDARLGGQRHVLVRLLRDLQDAAYRDRFLRRMTADTTDWQDQHLRWQALLAVTPLEHCAPVATIAGLAAWQAGDGLRASIAYRIALDADPDYRLARLLLTGLQAGLPPSMWVHCLRAGPAPRAGHQ